VRLESLPSKLSDEERRHLLTLADDLPAVWRAPTTRPQDRKRIARCLIDQVVVTVPKQGPRIGAEVHWTGGEVTTLEVERGRTGCDRWTADPELIELMRTLAQEFSDVQIARILHRRRLRTPKGLPFTAQRVAGLRNNYGIAPGPRVPRTGEEIYTAEQAAEILEVTRSTVIRWAEVGLLRGAQVTAGAPWRIQLTEDDVRRLKATDVPEGWLTLKAAALALGVSQQTVVQRLNSGQLEGVRVLAGRRTAWRVKVDEAADESQLELYE